MSTCNRLPSRIGTITLRSIIATDSSSFSIAFRRAISSAWGECTCARAEGAGTIPMQSRIAKRTNEPASRIDSSILVDFGQMVLSRYCRSIVTRTDAKPNQEEYDPQSLQPRHDLPRSVVLEVRDISELSPKRVPRL